MSDLQNENLEDLMKIYTSPEQIKQAMKEKRNTDKEGSQSIGEQLKHYPKPQRQLDLHEHTGKEATLEIEHFIKSSQIQRLRTVKIITGKGLHSKQQQSILPQLTEQMLSDLKKKNVVLGYKWEKGKGALIVYLA